MRYENNPTTLILKNKSQLHVSLSYDDDDDEDQEEEKEGSGSYQKTTISIAGTKPFKMSSYGHKHCNYESHYIFV